MRKFILLGILIIVLLIPLGRTKATVGNPCENEFQCDATNNEICVKGVCRIKIGGKCGSDEECVPGAKCVAQPTGESICEYIGYGEDLGYRINLPQTTEPDIRVTIIRIINYILSFMAIIGVVMVIIGGLTWATAGGNEEKVGKAKKTIIAAVVGLAIVLLAWVIVNYVITIIQSII